MKSMLRKLSPKVSEGKRRLRLFASGLLAVGVYVTFLVDDYRVDDAEIFLIFPLMSAAGFLVFYLLITLCYWVLDGFEKDAPKEQISIRTSSVEASSAKEQEVDSLATSFVRNTGSRFDSFCSKHGYSELFDNKGPFFAWSILWLAINKLTRPSEELRSITIEPLSRVLKVNREHTLKAVDSHLADKTGSQEGGFEKTAQLLGLDLDRIEQDANHVFVGRLDEAVKISLGRIQSDEQNKFVPILDVLMARNSKSGVASKFDQMSDDEFEFLFLEQCVESFTDSQNMARGILRKYRQEHQTST